MSGEELRDDETLLVISEQGFGDALQFMNANVSICAPPKLHGLIRESGLDENPLTLDQGNEFKAGKWISMMCLIRVLGVNPSHPIEQGQYIKTSSDSLSSWTTRLANERTLVKSLFAWHDRSISRMIVEQQSKKRSIPPIAQPSWKKSHTSSIDRYLRDTPEVFLCSWRVSPAQGHSNDPMCGKPDRRQRNRPGTCTIRRSSVVIGHERRSYPRLRIAGGQWVFLPHHPVFRHQGWLLRHRCLRR